MPNYTVIQSDIAMRDDTMMSREGRIASDVPYNQLAPGLYPDETLVELDTGERIAVSVELEWQPNSQGVTLTGYARHVEDDGTTKTAPDGKHVEVGTSHGFTQEDVAAYGIDALMAEVARVMLGEPPVLMNNEDGGPVLAVAEVIRSQSSVRAALATISQIQAATLQL
jgi:hypothetical protein